MKTNWLVGKLWSGLIVAVILGGPFSLGKVYAEDCREGARLYNEAVASSSLQQRIELLRRSCEQCPDVSAFMELGKAYQENNRLADAERAFNEACDLPRATAEAKSKALVALGSLFERKKDLTAAITSYRQALSLHDYPKVRERILILEDEKSKTVVSSTEITRSLTSSHRGNFAVKPTINLPVQFAYDTAELNQQGIEQAKQLGQALSSKECAGKHVELLGHTDLRGADAYNLQLSTARAEAVKVYLLQHYPLNASRISIKGMGKTQPLFLEDDERAHRVNRRVEVRLAE